MGLGENITLASNSFVMTDVDDESLQAIRIESLPSKGQISLSGNAVTLNQVIPVSSLSDNLLVYHTDSLVSGSDISSFETTLSYSVSDGTDYSTLPGELTFRVDSGLTPLVISVSPPTDKNLKLRAKIEVLFSANVNESITGTGALNPLNYSLSGTAAANGIYVVDLQGEGSGPYQFTVSDNLLQGDLTLEISGIADEGGNVMSAPFYATWRVPKGISIARHIVVYDGGTTRLDVKDATGNIEISIVPPDRAEWDDEDKIIKGINTGNIQVVISDDLGNTVEQHTSVYEAKKNPRGYPFPRYEDGWDYELVSFPYYTKYNRGILQSGRSTLLKILEKNLGKMSDTSFLVWDYYDSGEFGTYQLIGDQNRPIKPGRGFWMGVLDGGNVDVDEVGPQLEEMVDIELYSGWNLCGNPYPRTIFKDEIFIEDVAGNLITLESQPSVSDMLWQKNLGERDYIAPGYIDPGKGFWLKNLTGTEKTLVFAPDLSRTKARPKSGKVFRLTDFTDTDEPLPPAPPSDSSSSSAYVVHTAAGGGGGGGCLLNHHSITDIGEKR
jgi:hypothetical protein